MMQPCASLVAALLAGILLGYYLPVSPPLALLLGTTVAAGLLAALLKRFRPSAVWLFLLLLGWTNYNWHTVAHDPHDLRRLFGNQPVRITLIGKLVATPRWKIGERRGQETWRSAARVAVEEIVNAEAPSTPVTGEILVTTPGILGPQFFAGQTVEVSGTLQHPPGALAEGLFDYRQYLEARGIYYELRVDSTNRWSLRPPYLTRPPITDKFLDWSRTTLAYGLPEEDEPLQLLWAMVELQ